jgi:hypothetical protein
MVRRDSVISLNAVRETARTELENVLNSMPGDKVLVLDDQIIGPLGLVAPASLLKEHKVKKMYKLNEKPFDVDRELKNILYIVRPRMHLMKWIGTQVQHFTKDKNGTLQSFNRLTL